LPNNPHNIGLPVLTVIVKFATVGLFDKNILHHWNDELTNAQVHCLHVSSMFNTSEDGVKFQNESITVGYTAITTWLRVLFSIIHNLKLHVAYSEPNTHN